MLCDALILNFFYNTQPLIDTLLRLKACRDAERCANVTISINKIAYALNVRNLEHCYAHTHHKQVHCFEISRFVRKWNGISNENH